MSNKLISGASLILAIAGLATAGYTYTTYTTSLSTVSETTDGKCYQKVTISGRDYCFPADSVSFNGKQYCVYPTVATCP